MRQRSACESERTSAEKTLGGKGRASERKEKRRCNSTQTAGG